MSWYNPSSWWNNTPTPPVVVPPTPASPSSYHDLRSECVNGLTTSQQSDLQSFLNCYNNNLSKYQEVGQRAGIPAMLVAAIHWREASGNFTCYLEQGDPLGTRTYANGDSNNGVSLPVGTPNTVLFTDWIDAAVWALNQETEGKAAAGISYSETDVNDMLTFAEYYNGTGYMKMGVPSPYTLSGTSCYTRGKYTSDGSYNPNVVDEQIGVLVMLRAIISSN